MEIAGEIMANYSRFGDHTLLTWLKHANKQKKHKREVMSRHKLGTTWHRRAAREFVVYVKRVKELEEELSRRGVGTK